MWTGGRTEPRTIQTVSTETHAFEIADRTVVYRLVPAAQTIITNPKGNPNIRYEIAEIEVHIDGDWENVVTKAYKLRADGQRSHTTPRPIVIHFVSEEIEAAAAKAARAHLAEHPPC